jgi:hypothetical protein
MLYHFTLQISKLQNSRWSVYAYLFEDNLIDVLSFIICVMQFCEDLKITFTLMSQYMLNVHVTSCLIEKYFANYYIRKY